MTGSDRNTFEPPRPKRRWQVWVGVAAVAAVALVWGGPQAYEYAFVRCGDGVREEGEFDECVGVSDGAYHFDPSLKDVMDKIHAENRRVEKTGEPWVGIAYMEPMTLGRGDKGKASISQEFQGAYLAQVALNDHRKGGLGDRPQIKLLPGNPGRGSAQWQPVVERIAGMTDGVHPVVAVAGFGQSLETTRKAITALRAHGITTVGSTVTADDLNEEGDNGFFRAVSPNSAQASAIAKDLAAQQRAKPGFTVQVVYDRNQEDIYNTSLLAGFRAAAKKNKLKLEPLEEPFVSRTGATQNALAQIARNVCHESGRPDAVYYAGRGMDLKSFIEAAGANGGTCPLTVYTGDEAVGIFYDIAWSEKREEYKAFLQHWKHSKIKVQYTALAHPDAAEHIYAGTDVNPFPAFREEYQKVFGGTDSLLNGQAMLGHDTVRAIGTAIRYVAEGRNKVTAEDVLAMMVRITGEDRLNGVSGPLDFNDRGDPRDKPLPLVELRPKYNEEYAYQRILKP